MVGRGRGSVCLELGLDQTQPLADVLSHLSPHILQETGLGGGRIRLGLGHLYHLLVHLHLRAGAEAMAAATPRPLHQPSWHLDRECLLDHFDRPPHSDHANATNLDAAVKESGEDWSDAGIRSWILVSQSAFLYGMSPSNQP